MWGVGEDDLADYGSWDAGVGGCEEEAAVDGAEADAEEGEEGGVDVGGCERVEAAGDEGVPWEEED